MNKVTLEQIISKIKGETYIVLPDGRTTVCMLTLENGYTIKGLSACVDEAAFDLNMGRKIALDDAIRQVWPLEGYLLAEKLYWDRAVPVATNPPPKVNVPKDFMLNAEQVKAMKDAGFWDDVNIRKKTIEALARDNVKRKPKKSRLTKRPAAKKVKNTNDAPWGYKADGTPKKRMGRPPKSVK